MTPQTIQRAGEGRGPCVVIPNHHPHLDFLSEWGELEGVHLIVVQDSSLKKGDVWSEDMLAPSWASFATYDWDDVEDELLDRAWIFPKRTSARRCFGFWKAWQQGYDPILTLDTDCYPERPIPYWLDEHQRNLDREVTLGWVRSVPLVRTRGFPYRVRDKHDVWLSHGTWSGVPDFDAPSQLLYPHRRFAKAEVSEVVPLHNFFPMCGMNLAFRRELAPAMYFGLHGPDWGIDRFDDIFSGILAKRVLDHLGKAAVTGAPSVEHRRQSDVFANLRKEAPGMELNENLWQAVRDVPLTTLSVHSTYRALIEGLPDVIEGEPPGWTRSFREAALLWLGLFDE